MDAKKWFLEQSENVREFYKLESNPLHYLTDEEKESIVKAYNSGCYDADVLDKFIQERIESKIDEPSIHLEETLDFSTIGYLGGFLNKTRGYNDDEEVIYPLLLSVYLGELKECVMTNRRGYQTEVDLENDCITITHENKGTYCLFDGFDSWTLYDILEENKRYRKKVASLEEADENTLIGLLGFGDKVKVIGEVLIVPKELVEKFFSKLHGNTK